MRIGGAFPFGQQAVPIGLAPGQVFYLPPGNYYFNAGQQTVAQVQDSTNAIWRNVAWPGASTTIFSADGYNYRLANLSGCCAGALITVAGSGGTNGIGATATGAVVSFGAAPANGVAATAYPIVGGKLSGLTIAAGGSGFVMPPQLLIDPPPFGGIQATATCTISGGVINAVTLQNAGAGYIATPNVYIIPQFATYPGVGQPVNATIPVNIIPPGTVLGPIGPPMLPAINFFGGVPITGGASITVNGLTGSGTLTGIVMTNYGAGYTGTTIPSITFTGITSSAATAIMSLCVTAVGTGGAAGTGYTIGAPWESSLGLVATTDGCNGVFNPIPARGVIASTTGFTTSAATIENPGFGLQKVPVASILPFTTTPSSISTTTLTCGGQFDISYLQPAVED